MQFNKSNWQKIQFGQVVFERKKSVDPETAGLDRYIAGEHMNTEDLYLRSWGTVGEGYLGPAFHRKFETGDILYGSRRTYLKKVAVADFAGITANTTFVLTENTDLVIPGFIPFLMLSDHFTEHSVKNSKGSVNPYINFKDIAKYEFLLPPKEQQSQLAELLWAADEVVEQESLKVKALLAVKDALLFNAFSGSNDPRISIEKVGKWVSGGTPNRSKEQYWNGTIPWASPKDMKVDFLATAQEFITEEGAKGGTAVLPEKTLLMVVRGMILAHTFPVAMTTTEMAFNQDMKALIVNSDFEPLFVFYFLKYSAQQVLANAAESSHGTKRIPTEVLFSLQIPRHTKEDQAVFLATLNGLETVINDSNSQTQLGITVKNALINQIFSTQPASVAEPVEMM